MEKREQEAGLRCCDMSCGVGPSDEDPWVDVGEQELKQLSIRTATPSPPTPPPSHTQEEKMNTLDSGVGFSNDIGDGKEKEKLLCVHTFHSSCLVSSERVSLALRDQEVEFVGPRGEQEVEVSCPICRGVGRVTKEEWDTGVEALA